MSDEFRTLTYRGKAVTDRMEGYREIIDPEDLDLICDNSLDWDDNYWEELEEDEEDEAYWDNYLDEEDE